MNSKNKKQILDEVEKTLNSFDNDNILEANPFLVTRIKTKLAGFENQRKNKLIPVIGWKQALLLLVILINTITLIYSFERKTKQNFAEELIIELKSDFQIDQTEEKF